MKNGTYAGVYNAQYDQDFFLGVPYAQPPVGGLRFRVPQSLNSTWSGTHSAAQYSAECVGYGSDQWNYPISEVSLLRSIRYTGIWAEGLRTVSTLTSYVLRALMLPRTFP